MSHDTHETAPTQLVQVGDVQFAYRRFGRRGGVPYCFSTTSLRLLRDIGTDRLPPRFRLSAKRRSL
jgi:hypothetical protein